MTESLPVLVDSEALAAPLGPLSPEVARDYVQRLVDLASLLEDRRFRLLRSDRAWEVLTDANRIPPWDGSPIDDFVQGGDLLSLFIALVERTRTVEMDTGIRDVLFETLFVEPSTHLSERHSDLRTDYERMLVLWWLAAAGSSARAEAPIVAAGLTGPISVSIGVDVVELDPPEAVLETLPITLHVEAVHVGSCADLSRAVRPHRLLMAGAFELAVRAEVSARDGHNVNWLEAEINFGVLPGFEPSAADLGFFSEQGRARRLLRACVDVLTNVRNDQSHELRTSDGGNAPQVVRSADGAKAWRKDIDYEYHLHYWRIEGHTEFAKVAVHDDFSIRD